MKALVIFSGGQDSTTCLLWAKKMYEEVEAVSFVYGQKHSVEIEIAKGICNELEVGHKIVDISFFGQLVESNLIQGRGGDVNESHSKKGDLPSSWVPNRNAIFITIAHSIAQTIGADILVTGVSQADYSGYPDCRQVFIDKIQDALNTGAGSIIGIKTPLMYRDKKGVWALSDELGGLEYVRDRSFTCYNGIETMNFWGMGCGTCNACILRRKGYEEYIDEYNINAASNTGSGTYTEI